MNIREALAAQGNAPLVFMGGTCAGPNWRERLCGQVNNEFRWFNPVVDEWTDQAKETELVVRQEANVLLYVITPYQDGCYSYLELTEDAVRRGRTCVVCFLPSFEDKAFNEHQWSSIISARKLLERNDAKVLLSLEELVDYFNNYTPLVEGSRLLDTAGLVRRAEQNPIVGAPPAMASKLLERTQAERINSLSKPTASEPGTVTATSLLGKVATESLIDNIRGWLMPKPKPTDKPTKQTKPTYTGPRFSTYQLRTEIINTFADPEWLKEHWKPEIASKQNWSCLLINNQLPTNPESQFPAALKMATQQLKRIDTVCQRYQKQILAIDANIQRRSVSGEIDAHGVIDAIIQLYGPVKTPMSAGDTEAAVFGGCAWRLTHEGEEYQCVETLPNDVSPSSVTPELVAGYFSGLARTLDNLKTYIELATPYTDGLGLGLRADDDYWRYLTATQANVEYANAHPVVWAMVNRHCNAEGTEIGEIDVMVQAIASSVEDAIDSVLDAIDNVTGRKAVAMESNDDGEYEIVDLGDGGEHRGRMLEFNEDLFQEELAGYRDIDVNHSITKKPDGGHYYGAVGPDGQVVGMVNYDYNDDLLHVGGLYVRPEYRRQGLGRKLLRRVMKDHGKGRTASVHTRANQPALQMYYDHGFRDSGMILHNPNPEETIDDDYDDYDDTGDVGDVGMESLFDGIVNFFKGYGKDSPGDMDGNGKRIDDERWAKEQRESIRKTFGNPGWVRANYHPIQKPLDTKQLTALSIGGTIPKPNVGLKETAQSIENWLRSEAPPVKRYAARIETIENDAQVQFTRGVDHDDIKRYLLNEGRKLSIPVRLKDSPSLPGGTHLQFDKTKPSKYTVVKDTLPESAVAPELSVEDVVATGEVLSHFAETYMKLLPIIDYPGSGCDDGLWLDSDFDYDEKDMEEIHELYYHQSKPEEATTGLHESVWIYAEYLRAVGRWLQAYTR